MSRRTTVLAGLTAALCLPWSAVAAGGVPATSDSTAPGAHRVEDAEEARARPRPARSLRVSVSAPRDARAQVRVVVTGPPQRARSRVRFKRTISRTTTWRGLRPGVYKVKAVPVELYDQRVVPTVTRTRVRITARRRGQASAVTYAAPTFCSAPVTSGRPGQVAAWGDNSAGQLGTSPGGLSTTPVVNPWLHGVTAATGSRTSSYALCGDGTVWSWGANGANELGIGRTGSRTWPVQVPGLTGVTAVAAGTDAAYALTGTGTVHAWGSGRYGQLGDGRSGFGTTAATPVTVALPGPAVAVAAGGYTAYALLADGRVATWGSGGVGQRGDGTSGESTPTPVVVAGLSGVTQVAAGAVTGYALTSSGEVWAWGGSNQGEIPGTAPSTTVPVKIASGATLIGASRSAGYYLDATGLVGFGSGRHHDAGRDTGGSIAAPGPTGVAGTGGIVQVVGAGGTAYVRFGIDPYVKSWGENGRGQIGSGVPVTGPSATDGVLPSASGAILIPQVAELGAVTSIGAGQLNGYAVH